MIDIVTFPRSGHHWLMKMCGAKFGLPKGWHCDTHTHKPDERTLVRKTHDFELDFEPKGAFIIQTRRDIVASIQSWFDLFIKQGYGPDTKDCWAEFAARRIFFAVAWHKKWVDRYPNNVIYYETLREQPERFVDLLGTELKKQGVACKDNELPKNEHRIRRTSEYRYASDAKILEHSYRILRGN